MTNTRLRAKHRAARRPIHQIFVDAAGDNLAAAGRRSAAVAASSGLLVSMIAVPANAAPNDVSGSSVGATDVSALTKQAREQLTAAPAITTASAEWDVEIVALEVTPAPEPEPEPEPVVVAASRSTQRTATATQTETTAATPAAETETVAAAVENTAPPAAAAGSSIIEIAGRYVGVPYVSGGSSPSGFDCSGFTSYVYAQLGISLPRTSSSQRNAGTVVSRDQAQPGDIIWSPGHVAIYAGGNTQIDAPKPGGTVQFREIWQSNPTFIRIG